MTIGETTETTTETETPPTLGTGRETATDTGTDTAGEAASLAMTATLPEPSGLHRPCGHDQTRDWNGRRNPDGY